MATVATRTPSAAQTYPAGVLALDPVQCGQALGLTRTKVFQLLASGAIRSVKIGRYRRIPVAEIEAFLRRELEKQSA